MGGRLRLQRFDSWSIRAPWAIYGLAPVFLLGLAYFTACFVLWSGWRIFLAGQNSPFVPVYGLPEYYFGIGRLLYETAPVLVGRLPRDSDRRALVFDRRQGHPAQTGLIDVDQRPAARGDSGRDDRKPQPPSL